jgi:hypothetical protein
MKTKNLKAGCKSTQLISILSQNPVGAAIQGLKTGGDLKSML